MGARRNLRRWHIRLGWLVGIPMLLWTLSGVVMVLKPIEEVRGATLLRDPAAMRFDGLVVPPSIAGVPLKSLTLEPRAGGARWVIVLANGTTRLADPASGALVPPISAADAAREVTARYAGTASIQSVTRTNAGHPPLDLRRPIAAWQVTMSDGTHFYVDAGSGEVVARRTRWWRFYDLMWGLHIMDPQTREDTHNPWIVGFGIAAFVTTLLALILLPMTLRRRRNGGSLDS
jgi:hypothetical protein